MRENQHRSWSPRTALAPEQVLELYYGKLRKWGVILTRGDTGMAQEIVHDFCLYLTVVKPDLSQVENLDGYLYTSLRHIYLSALARSSREAVQFVSIADFDSIQFALNPSTTDNLLERQNELRRICSYSVWRKDSSKSASYFILHFFHGYARREIAEIACLPIAAIYNKLKVARAEVKSHLEASGKLRIALREAPPEPELLLSPISSTELFDNLQQTIFDAKDSECLSEETLLKQYQTARPKPIPCGLLSHIVSCKRCLAAIDRHLQRPTWEDREPPDGVWSSLDRKDTNSAALDTKSYKALMRAVQWQRDRVHDHRPRTLSIAVNGKIAAFHDVQSERSTLAARIEYPEAAQFIEVFTDQQIRLAMLPIDERPPKGAHVHTQRVTLSDDRWLELVLSFDGLGLHSEVTYFDPTLAAQVVEEEVDEELPVVEAPRMTALLPVESIEPKEDSVFARITRSFREMSPRFALAWTMVVALILGGSGYLTYRYYNRAPQDANEVLNRSIQIESEGLKGESQHQVLQLAATDANGHAFWQGTVDVWKENDTGRTMRRLYDAQHRLVAAAWHGKDGQSGSSVGANSGDVSDIDREIAASALWQQDVSACAFHELASQQMQIRVVGEDYELASTDIASNPPHVVSATLVLDLHLHVISETLRVRDGSPIKEVRFVETDYERRPSPSVPATVFEPTDLDANSTGNRALSFHMSQSNHTLFGSSTQLVQLQMAVLYELNKLGADIGEPIEIKRTAEGRILVSGTVADNVHKQLLVSALDTLPDRQLLEIRLASQSDFKVPVRVPRATAQSGIGAYNLVQAKAPVDALLHGYFAGKGLTGDPANSAVAQFSHSALEHAQQALQHAYALDRLADSFAPDELRAISPVSQQQWAAMVTRHASALQVELRALHEQLAQLVPGGSQLPTSDGNSALIATPENFARSARELLYQTQTMNRIVGAAFSSGPGGNGIQDSHSLIVVAIQSIPVPGAEKLAAFASRLTDSKNTANRAREQDPRRLW
jgi:DNA-directed RNA polymerase specialized sigma24 family protein